MTGFPLVDIVADLGGELIGDTGARIDRLGALDGATPSTLSFLSSARYLPALASSAAACVIVAPAQRDAATARGTTIVTPDPYLYFAKLTQWWVRHVRPPAAPSVHASAVIDPSATVHETATIGPLVVIEAGASIGAGAHIGAQCFIGQRSRIGDGTRLFPRVTVMSDCRIGARCILHSGAVIGADGFGFAPHAGAWEKIEQLGGVRIDDDVDIGANTCVDRGALDDTVIEEGVKLDNQIQIAHNVHIGAFTAMAACVGVAGSATIGRHCMIGGAALIMGHITIVDRVNVSAGTFIMRSLHQPGHYTGVFPFDDNATWEKNAASLKQLYRLRERVRALEKKTTP